MEWLEAQLINVLAAMLHNLGILWDQCVFAKKDSLKFIPSMQTQSVNLATLVALIVQQQDLQIAQLAIKTQQTTDKLLFLLSQIHAPVTQAIMMMASIIYFALNATLPA